MTGRPVVSAPTDETAREPYSEEQIASDIGLVLDALADCPHPANADTCPFCEAVSALSRLAGGARREARDDG